MARTGAKIAAILGLWFQRHRRINGAGQVHIGFEVMALGAGQAADQPVCLGCATGVVLQPIGSNFSTPEILAHKIPDSKQQQHPNRGNGHFLGG